MDDPCRRLRVGWYGQQYIVLGFGWITIKSQYMPAKGQNKALGVPPILTRLPRPVYVRAESLAAGAGFTYHSHPWVQFLYASNGMLRVTLLSGSFAVPSRYAVWIPPGVEHQVTAVGTADFRSLYLDPASVAPAGERCHVVEVTTLARELILAAGKLPAEYDEHGRAGRLILTLLDELAALQEANVYLPTPADPRLRRICDALLRNPADSRELSEWAASVNVSVRTLARLFEKEIDMGFREWRQRLRLSQALERLAEGASVTATAIDVGYGSTSAFIAAFKAQFGKLPTEFT